MPHESSQFKRDEKLRITRPRGPRRRLRRFALLAVVTTATAVTGTFIADAMMRTGEHQQPKAITISSGIAGGHSFEGAGVRDIHVRIDITPHDKFVDITYFVTATAKQIDLRNRDAFRVTLPTGTSAIGREYAGALRDKFAVGPRRIKEVHLPVTPMSELDKPLTADRPFMPIMTMIKGEGQRRMQVQSLVTARVQLGPSRVERIGVDSRRIRILWDPMIGPALPIRQVQIYLHQGDTEISAIRPTPRLVSDDAMSLRVPSDEKSSLSMVLVNPIAKTWISISRWLIGSFLVGGLVVGVLTGWIGERLLARRRPG
jgi:hypothetical protein